MIAVASNKADKCQSISLVALNRRGYPTTGGGSTLQLRASLDCQSAHHLQLQPRMTSASLWRGVSKGGNARY